MTQGTPDSVTSYFTSTSLSAGMGGQYEAKDGAVKKYYSIAGMMVAVNDGTGLQYLLTDHLGSTVAVTNASGTLTSQQRYLPFGEARAIPNSPILGTDFGYTGQRLLDEGMGGIMDYKARFYSPALGRFIQPDSIIPDATNPQAFNRFSYVINNPIRYNDPAGHCFGPVVVICGEIIVGIAVLAAVELTIYYTINTPEGERLRNQTAYAMSSAIDSVSQFAKQRQTKEEKARAELEAIFRLTADDMFAPIRGCKGPLGKVICISGIIAIAAFVLAAPKRGACEQDEAAVQVPCEPDLGSITATPTTDTTSTPVPTSTTTTTSTPTSTSTSIPTSNPTSTPTIPPTTPIPYLTPPPSNRNRIVFPI